MAEKDSAGYICIEAFASPAECQAMKEKANQFVEDFHPEQYTVFSASNTSEQVRHSTL